jgi:hypothetical protein
LLLLVYGCVQLLCYLLCTGGFGGVSAGGLEFGGEDDMGQGGEEAGDCVGDHGGGDSVSGDVYNAHGLGGGFGGAVGGFGGGVGGFGDIGSVFCVGGVFFGDGDAENIAKISSINILEKF